MSVDIDTNSLIRSILNDQKTILEMHAQMTETMQYVLRTSSNNLGSIRDLSQRLDQILERSPNIEALRSKVAQLVHEIERIDLRMRQVNDKTTELNRELGRLYVLEEKSMHRVDDLVRRTQDIDKRLEALEEFMKLIAVNQMIIVEADNDAD